MYLSDQECGMTLIELLVVVTILGIILSQAIPSIKQLRANMEANRIKSLLFSALKQAKSESYLTKQNILFCLSAGGGICQKDNGKTLLLFIDKNNNKRFDTLSDQLILKEALNLKYATLRLRASGHAYVKFFGSTGTPKGYQGHVKYCPTNSDPNLMYQVSFNRLGGLKYKPNQQHATGCDKQVGLSLESLSLKLLLASFTDSSRPSWL